MELFYQNPNQDKELDSESDEESEDEQQSESGESEMSEESDEQIDTGDIKNKILLVDDCDTNLIALECILGSKYKIPRRIFNYKARNGQQAVDMIAEDLQKNGGETTFKLIFMDNNMPLLSGCEATKEIKQMCPQITIFSVSGHTGESYEREAIDAGMSKCFEKPLQAPVIEQDLRQLGYI